jgi:hypothetical protein
MPNLPVTAVISNRSAQHLFGAYSQESESLRFFSAVDFKSSATLSRSDSVKSQRFGFFGKYCRNSPFVFSFDSEEDISSVLANLPDDGLRDFISPEAIL